MKTSTNKCRREAFDLARPSHALVLAIEAVDDVLTEIGSDDAVIEYPDLVTAVMFAGQIYDSKRAISLTERVYRPVQDAASRDCEQPETEKPRHSAPLAGPAK